MSGLHVIDAKDIFLKKEVSTIKDKIMILFVG